MPSVYEYATEWSERDLKKEYSRLRDAFQKQIGRLAEKDQSSRVKAFLPGGYKYQRTIKDIENLRGRKNWTERSRREDWARRIAELKELRSARSLSISGRKAIRQETIKTLKEEGLTGINGSNYDQFVNFMNFAKAQGLLDQYDSQQIAEAFNDWVEGGILENDELAAYLEEWSDSAGAVDLFD